MNGDAVTAKTARPQRVYELLPCRSNSLLGAWSDGLMWYVIARRPLPDAAYWPGRRWLAAIDAVAWPCLIGALAAHAPRPVGIVGPVVVALAVVVAIGRLSRAVLRNERYRFTTWRWGRVIAMLLMLGIVLKLVALQ